MTLERNNIIPNQDAPEPAKKPYAAPQLIVYGNIEQITQGGFGDTGDDEGGSMGG